MQFSCPFLDWSFKLGGGERAAFESLQLRGAHEKHLAALALPAELAQVWSLRTGCACASGRPVSVSWSLSLGAGTLQTLRVVSAAGRVNPQGSLTMSPRPSVCVKLVSWSRRAFITVVLF